MLNKHKIIVFLVLLFGLFVACLAVQFDTEKYIGVDEIKAGMECYALTCYQGVTIEKFDMEVLSVVRDFSPGRDMILVRGLDERFIHTGPVAGCSGSPVFIEGRLAGALANGWSFSKDPLYGVTPIADMLRVGEKAEAERGKSLSASALSGIDYSMIDLSAAAEALDRSIEARRSNSYGMENLPLAVSVSGLGDEGLASAAGILSQMGLNAVSGRGRVEVGDIDIKFERGSTIAIPLVDGDIVMAAVGTVTEVRDGEIFGFGHSMFGEGAVDMPIATGYIHTVVSSVVRSFKLGMPIRTVGALRSDESTAIRGTIGAEAKLIPFKIKVDRYNELKAREYNCMLATHKQMTPLLVGSVMSGASMFSGNIPARHTIRYSGNLKIEGGEVIRFDNVTSGLGLSPVIQEVIGAVAVIMNNPYKEASIESIDLSISIDDASSVGRIWSVELSESEVLAGESVEVRVVSEGYLRPKREHVFTLEIDKNTAEGNYTLSVLGGGGYLDFLRKTESWKFKSENFESLTNSIKRIVDIRRDMLYCVLALGKSGIVIEGSGLKDLPATRSMILADGMRSLDVKGYPQWTEASESTEAVIIGSKSLKLKVVSK
jgi:hypothetical protein